MSTVALIVKSPAWNENEEEDRKSQNLFIFIRNLQTILLTGKLKNYRIISLLVIFLIT